MLHLVESKRCNKCETEKPLARFPKGKNTCLDCRAAKARDRYSNDPAMRAANVARAKAWAEKRHLSAEHRERWRKQKRDYRRRKGALSRAEKRRRAFERAQTALAIRNAREAWRWWIDVRAPDEWIAEYWTAAGRPPWTNPRLSAAQAWVVRYNHDEGFRFTQAQRLRDKMKRRKALLRRGTLSRAEERELREAATECFYCGEELVHDVELQPRSATLDHRVPLTKGGAHSAANVVPCCLSCNSRKQDRVA